MQQGFLANQDKRKIASYNFLRYEKSEDKAVKQRKLITWYSYLFQKTT